MKICAFIIIELICLFGFVVVFLCFCFVWFCLVLFGFVWFCAKFSLVRVESFLEVKTLSLKSDASLSELQTKLSQLWSKPLESLSFFTAEGQPLETEEKWQELRSSSHIEAGNGMRWPW